jgi:hypothetical protein
MLHLEAKYCYQLYKYYPEVNVETTLPMLGKGNFGSNTPTPGIMAVLN